MEGKREVGKRTARRRRRRRRRRCIGLAGILLLTGLLVRYGLAERRMGRYEHQGSGDGVTLISSVDSPFRRSIAAFAQEQGLSLADWPEELLEQGEKNPEMEAFVRDYPLKRGETPEIDLSAEAAGDTVPLLMQWDQRWGYTDYAGGVMGLSGCGPTCLSMVSLALLHDPSLTPRRVAEFGEANGYSVSGNGSAWTLISQGGPQLGLDVTELPLDKARIFRELEAGYPIICVMGPGDFTTTGHYIVLRGVESGKLQVNDPNSAARSGELWDYDQIESQFRNLWVCRPAVR